MRSEEHGRLARVSLAGQKNPQPENASPAGTLPADQSLSVSVIVRRRNPLELSTLAGRTLTHEEFEQQYGASPEDFAALRAFADRFSLTVNEGRSSLARRTLVLEGTPAQMEEAFGISLRSFTHLPGGPRFHSYTGEISVPEEHAPLIESVLGLDTRPIARSHLRWLDRHADGRILRASAAAASYTPPQVAELYGFPAALNGEGQTVGILELGGGFEASDIATYFQGLGLTAPQVTAVSVDGGANVPGGDPNGADGEVALDIQVAGAVANGIRMAVYFAPNTDQGFIDAITTAVHDTTNKPSILSISWGGPESGWTAASRTSLDNACQSAAALGVTITVACGDNGSTDGSTGNNVDFPASSPHVLACGGTRLTGTGADITAEVVWNDLSSGGGATGGGVSTVFALPTWQDSANVPAPAGSAGGRGVPDICGDASPETGYSILVDGQQAVVGGTSAVAPLWAGLLALVNQSRAARGLGPAGFINPQLYANPSALRDITSGSNGALNAGPGWDACTGLGSPRGADVVSVLSENS